METKYIFQNTTYLDHNFNPQKGDVLIKNDEIFKIKNIKDKKSRPIKLDKSYKVIDCENKLLMPGFYNNHAHSAMSLLRGYAENLTLDEWLTKKIFPIEMNFDDESIKAGVDLSILESLKNGIVSTRDMYFSPKITYDAYKKALVKVNFGRAIVDDNGKKLKDNNSFIEAKEIDDYVKKNSKDDKIKIDYSLHAEYTSTKKIAQELSDYLKNKSNFFNVHISETKKEVKECYKKYRKSPVKYFYDLGLLNSKTIGAHLVHIDDQDLKLLKKSKTTVAINPISNLKLSSGVSRLSDFYNNGIKVTIGTDSVASNKFLEYNKRS
ncbi:MAG: amidohydrolase partial [Methanobrevibacter sp. CfCl-M3]